MGFKIAGLGVIGVGGASQYFFGDVCQKQLKISIGYIAIIVGTIISLQVLIILGVASVRRPSSSGIFLLGLTFIVIIASGALLIYAGMHKEKIVDNAETCVDRFFDKYNESEDSLKAIDLIQEHLVCCGKKGPKSYPVDKIPSSCCAPETETCTKASAIKDIEGCATKIVYDLNTYYPAILGTIGGIFGLMLILAFYACYNLVRRNEEYFQ